MSIDKAAIENEQGVIDDIVDTRLKKYTILIIDSDKQFVTEVCDGLEVYSDQLQCKSFSDSSAAMRYLKKSNPDLVLLNIHMPKIDGWKIAAHIHKESTAFLVFLCDEIDSITKEKALRIAQELIVKPINIIELKEILLDILAKKK